MDSEKQLIGAKSFKGRLLIECTIGDRLLARTPVSCLFFYSEAYCCSDLLHGLKVALAEYPFFAGRLLLKDGELYIDCSNQGALYCINFHDKKIEDVINELDSLSRENLVEQVKNSPGNYAVNPLIAITIGYFNCGGMSIGVSWHHSLGDMHTLMQFMRAWASAVNQEAIVKPLLLNSRKGYLAQFLTEADTSEAIPLVRRYKRRELIKLYGKLLIASARTDKIIIYFSPAELKSMRQTFSERAGCQLSINECLSSHIAHALFNVSQQRKSIDLAVTINYRKLLGMSEYACGNFIAPLFSECCPTLAPHQTALHIKTARHDKVSLRNTLARTRLYVTRKSRTSSFKQFIPIALSQDRQILLTTNWSRFGALNLCFGSSKPFLFIPYGQYDIPFLCGIVESFSGYGLLALIVLPHSLNSKSNRNGLLEYLHMFRPPTEEPPETISSYNWLC